MGLLYHYGDLPADQNPALASGFSFTPASFCGTLESLEDMDMNERQLKSFILATELKSFSKAADSSFISTSALIGQINLLEKDIGFSLFHRTYHGIALTPSGGTWGRVICPTCGGICDHHRCKTQQPPLCQDKHRPHSKPQPLGKCIIGAIG